jgi:hypothetical protein
MLGKKKAVSAIHLIFCLITIVADHSLFTKSDGRASAPNSY